MPQRLPVHAAVAERCAPHMLVYMTTKPELSHAHDMILLALGIVSLQH